MAKKFATSLPESKLSMAKLQGHFLKYKNDPDSQLKFVKEIIDDQLGEMQNMTMVEWLRRLNLG